MGIFLYYIQSHILLIKGTIYIKSRNHDQCSCSLQSCVVVDEFLVEIPQQVQSSYLNLISKN